MEIWKKSTSVLGVLVLVAALGSCNASFTPTDDIKLRPLDISKLDIVNIEDFAMQDEELLSYLSERVLNPETIARMPDDQRKDIQFFHFTWTGDQCTYDRGLAPTWQQVDDECQRDTIGSYVTVAYRDSVVPEEYRGSLDAITNGNGCRPCNADKN